MKKLKFDILTLFPEMFSAYVNESILRRAQENNLIEINLHNWRDEAKGKHKQVDDKPYGGGAGMLLMVEPIYNQLKKIKAIRKSKKTRVLMMTPEGKQFTHDDAVRLSKYERLVLLCGRYEGFDERVSEYIDEKISVGPYVLAGGELPAMIVTEAVSRQRPGVLGHEEALKDETFTNDQVEYPQYTRPDKFKGLKVPDVLLSGDHKKIEEWRKSHSKNN